MAHVLSITDGTTTINLQETTDTGYKLVHVGAPRPNRLLTRVSGYPFVDGSRTTATALDDVLMDFVVCICGSSADDVESKLGALVRLLEAAQRWEVARTGAPVRVLFKRQGVTNQSSRVITGVPLMPEPQDTEEGDWLDISVVTNSLTIAFSLLMEPVAHAGALTTVRATQTKTNQPTANVATTSVTTGNMNGPLTVKIADNTTFVTWSTAFLVQLASTSNVLIDYSGTADANAYGGFARSDTFTTGTVTPTPTAGTVSLANQYPIRTFARISVTAGTPGKLQIRSRIVVGTVAVEGPWVTYPGGSNQYLLVDLGTFPAMSYLTTLAIPAGFTDIDFMIQLRSSDASSITTRTDYVEFLFYRGITRLEGFTASSSSDYVAYEAVQKSGTFFWPARSPRTFVIKTATLTPATRSGTLAPLLPNVANYLWIAIQSATEHNITDTFDVTIDHLPTYALGMRGNA